MVGCIFWKLWWLSQAFLRQNEKHQLETEPLYAFPLLWIQGSSIFFIFFHQEKQCFIQVTAHVGCCQLGPDYYPLACVSFSFYCHSSEHFSSSSMKSFLIVTKCNEKAQINYRLSVVMLVSVIFIPLSWEIQAWIFIGEWVPYFKTSRMRGLKFFLFLLSTTSSGTDIPHCCQRASALNISQEE